jgi:hypothetical protein
LAEFLKIKLLIKDELHIPLVYEKIGHIAYPPWLLSRALPDVCWRKSEWNDAS